MATESKKLQTIIAPPHGVCESCDATRSVMFDGKDLGVMCFADDTCKPPPCGPWDMAAIRALNNDAHIAHEQRDVIALLCKAIRGPEWADVALAAAAPFLED